MPTILVFRRAELRDASITRLHSPTYPEMALAISLTNGVACPAQCCRHLAGILNSILATNGNWLPCGRDDFHVVPLVIRAELCDALVWEGRHFAVLNLTFASFAPFADFARTPQRELRDAMDFISMPGHKNAATFQNDFPPHFNTPPYHQIVPESLRVMRKSSF